MSDEERGYAISLLAHELWEKAGRPNGKHFQLWQEAKLHLLHHQATANDLDATSQIPQLSEPAEPRLS